MLLKMDRRISSERAFTLIEVIVCLVLIGIMAAIAGMGLMRIAEGYVFAKQNAETVQKAQIAMARIVKELSSVTTISTATSNAVAYTRPGPVNNTLSISGGQVLISAGTTGILMNDVVTASSSFTYYDAAGSLIASPVAAVSTIRRIAIALRVSGANNTSIDFNNNVFMQEF